MKTQHFLFWKKVPFLKIFLATGAGIVFQWYIGFPENVFLITGLSGLAVLVCLFYSSLFIRFKYLFLGGAAASMIFFALGGLLVIKEDIRNNTSWFGKNEESPALIVEISEPLIEKPKTFKTTANVKLLAASDSFVPATGKIIVYFRKDANNLPSYGSLILVLKKPEEIRNFIAGFDYRRYCLFKGITHQVFLKQEDYRILDFHSAPTLRHFIFQCRDRTIRIIKKNIPGKKEAGLAEALLIGYKNDLDKELVQSYTNTGVVHIIAISGLHIGLIYLILSVVTKRLKKFNLLRAVIIICSLWLFSLMAGAQPSILRSSLMFTCLVIGESLGRRTSVYNTLAVSAFIIVCINPFALWDIGFQLSYAAVLSILVFMKPVYNLFFIKNKLLDLIWKMNAVTLAAQFLTIPLCLYHFKQFPNYFLLSNLIAIPLSGMILFGEIILCLISFIPTLSALTGNILGSMISFLNKYIEKIEALPWSVSKDININFIQMLVAYGLIITLALVWIEKNLKVLKYSLVAGLILVLISIFKLPLS